jgi:TatD DNase family protein
VVSFKNAHRVREVVASIPEDRILIETDAPYLAPVPYRGKLNHSGYMLYTADAVGGTLFTGVDDVIIFTRENAKRLFGIS